MANKLHTMGGNTMRLGITILLIGSCCFADSPPQNSVEANPDDQCRIGLTFNEGSGANNWGVKEYVMLFSGSATYKASGGQVGGAYYFNGTGNYLMESTLDRAWTSFMTSSSVWIKPNVYAQALGNVFGGGSAEWATQYGYGIQYGVGTVYAKGQNSSTDTRISAAFPNDGKWHHVAAIYTLAGKLYIDGEEVASGDLSKTWTYVFAVGAGVRYGSQPGLYFAGLIDEIILFDRVISVAEIKELYQRGKAGQ